MKKILKDAPWPDLIIIGLTVILTILMIKQWKELKDLEIIESR